MVASFDTHIFWEALSSSPYWKGALLAIELTVVSLATACITPSRDIDLSHTTTTIAIQELLSLTLFHAQSFPQPLHCRLEISQSLFT